jgi:hypothetical protein
LLRQRRTREPAPQAVVDNKGVTHLIYYKGDPKGGDIFYVRREPGAERFSRPLPVNRHAGTAIAMGTIRGAQLALGKNGRVHVAWDGMGGGISLDSRAGHSDDHTGHSHPTHEASGDKHPLYYTRLNDAGAAFEPERNVITYAYGLDGGSSVAADPHGNVYVVWHAPQPGNTNGEAGRAVFVARSSDEGKTFQRETTAISKPTGACACCGMRAFADSSGAAYILFRAATENVNRDETLLVSPKPAAPFEIASRHAWKATTCPMSSAALTEGKAGTLAAWETASQVYFAHINPKILRSSEPVSPPGGNGRKHPVAVANAKGETLLVWFEGTGWGQGGAVGWQVFDNQGKPTETAGHKDGIPIWSFATALVRGDDSFEIIY